MGAQGRRHGDNSFFLPPSFYYPSLGEFTSLNHFMRHPIADTSQLSVSRTDLCPDTQTISYIQTTGHLYLGVQQVSETPHLLQLTSLSAPSCLVNGPLSFHLLRHILGAVSILLFLSCPTSKLSEHPFGSTFTKYPDSGPFSPLHGSRHGLSHQHLLPGPLLSSSPVPRFRPCPRQVVLRTHPV